MVEELRDIDIDNEVLPFLRVLLCGSHGVDPQAQTHASACQGISRSNP